MPIKEASSIRNLAKNCGYHYSTVSLALRNSPKVNGETRRKILEAANKLGYKIDPSASILMSTVRQKRGLLSSFPIGMLNFHDREMPHANKMRKALIDFANRNQIPFNFFDLSQGEINQAQVARVAYSRGLKGLIFGGSSEESKLQWDVWSKQEFAYLVHSQRERDLQADHVTWDIFSIIETAVRNLEQKGCENFILLIKEFIDEGGGWHWTAACEMMRRKFKNQGKLDQRIEVFTNPNSAFKKWVRNHQPVGIIRIGTYVYKDSNISEVFPRGIDACSIEFPHSPSPDDYSIGYIEPDYDQIAETSFDTLCVNIFFNRIGIPDNPKRIYLRPIYRKKDQK